MTTDSQDDKVLEQLYKKGAKDTPPPKLNYEIINYAKNKKNSASVGSHFGGGWKVPLSMAASVVVVFALLVQLDQSPQELELPPIPEISIPTEPKSVETRDQSLEGQNVLEEEYEAEEAMATDDAPSFKYDAKELGLDSEDTGALIIDKPVRTESPTSIKRKDEQNRETTGDRTKTRQTIEKLKSSDEFRMQSNEPASAPTSPTTYPSSTTLKPNDEYAPKLAKPQTAQKKAQEPASGALNGNASEATSDNVMQQRSMNKESISHEDMQTSSDMDADTKLGDEEVQTKEVIEDQVEGEFAPIPVKDWLLMIERLVAKKDYAEAARQLEKFKQAHPKVNVEDLDAKIP